MVSTAVMNYLMEIVVLSVVFPVVFLYIWRLRTRKSMLPALAGAVVFIAFAKLLETIPYAVFVGFENPVSKLVRSNVLLYAVYQGVAFGILEELGRYLAFQYFLPKYRGNHETAITYGIGHGGIQCILTLGWASLQYYVVGIAINYNSDVAEDFPKETIEELTGLKLNDCIMETFTSVLFLILQVSLSILVFQACRNSALKRRLLCCAVLFHALAYLPSGLYLAKLVSHTLSLVFLAIVVFAAFAMAARIYREMGENEKKLEQQRMERSREKKGRGWDVAGKKLSDIEEDIQENEK